jgi:hypothetical protein
MLNITPTSAKALPASFSAFAEMQLLLHHLLRAVIATQGYFHDVARNNLAIFNNRHLRDPANSEYTCIGRIDDGSELVNTKHT